MYTKILIIISQWFRVFFFFKVKKGWRTFLVVQWLRLHHSNVGVGGKFRP